MKAVCEEFYCCIELYLSLPIQLLTTVRGGINNCSRRVAESYQINISHCLFKLGATSGETFVGRIQKLSISFASISPAANSFLARLLPHAPTLRDVCNISYYPPQIPFVNPYALKREQETHLVERAKRTKYGSTLSR